MFLKMQKNILKNIKIAKNTKCKKRNNYLVNYLNKKQK